EIRDQVRQLRQRLLDHFAHPPRPENLAFEESLEEVFHRPAEVTDGGGTHHTTTALEGVEAPAQFLQIRRWTSITAAIQAQQGSQYLAGFLDKDVPDF